MKVLNVAEKNDAAKNIARHLSGGQFVRAVRGNVVDSSSNFFEQLLLIRSKAAQVGTWEKGSKNEVSLQECYQDILSNDSNLHRPRYSCEDDDAVEMTKRSLVTVAR